MATTTKILATEHRYGWLNSYTDTSYLYIGKSDANVVYRSRLKFPTLKSVESIGDASIIISKVTLHLYRNLEGPTTVVAGSSSSGAWGAATDGSGSGRINNSNGWYAIDITNCAEAINEYGSAWFIHLTSSGSRVRCTGVGGSATPYINVVWEYAANTITTDVESVALGKNVTFNIAQLEGDARYTLSYEFGDESGAIADTAATSITWTPPVSFSSEIPNADSGEVKITMNVYDSAGEHTRTEVYYLTVTVPDGVAIKFQNNTFAVYTVNGLGYDGYSAVLAGKSAMQIVPTLDTTGAYGASIVSLRADIGNEGSVQSLEWANLTETDAGIFTGEVITSAILMNAGAVNITLTATDSRGREVSLARTFTVHAYSNPAITEFSVERYEPVYDENEQISGYVPSDIGENVWVTLKARCTNVVANGASRNFISWKITAKAADGAEKIYSGGGTAYVLDITEDRTIITAVVSAASAVEYTVEVKDTAGYAAYQYDNVTPGRANFALAPSKYGASFGCLPKGTENNPMLESAYPIYAYSGFGDFGGSVQGGVQNWGGAIAANSKKSIAVTFDEPFEEPPFVAVGLDGNSTSAKYGMISAFLQHGSVTTTGFICDGYNADSSSRSPWFSWIAIGKMAKGGQVIVPPSSGGDSGGSSGGGGALPEVSIYDNGKVLTVVNGVWAAANLPMYGGEYSVRPTTEDQTLLTSQKLLDSDLTVEKIPYSEVANTANGTTATIG